MDWAGIQGIFKKSLAQARTGPRVAKCRSRVPRRELFQLWFHIVRVIVAVIFLSVMPVTRSSSQQASQQPSSQPYSLRRADPSGSGGIKKSPKAPSNEIIILSSDDDEPPPKGIVISKKSSSRTVKKKAAPQVYSSEVLEISSDDEAPSPPKQHRSPKKTKKDVERTIKKLQDVRSYSLHPLSFGLSECHRSSNDTNGRSKN